MDTGNNVNINKKYLLIKTKLLYGASDLGTALPLAVVTFFLLYFCTDVVVVTPE